MKQIDHVLIGSAIILGAVILWFHHTAPLQVDPNSLWAYDIGLRSTYQGEDFSESPMVGVP